MKVHGCGNFYPPPFTPSYRWPHYRLNLASLLSVGAWASGHFGLFAEIAVQPEGRLATAAAEAMATAARGRRRKAADAASL